MTSLRLRWKRALGLAAGLAIVLTAAMVLLWASGGPIAAATTERVVIDRLTGLALSGYDPVAYFSDGKALAGRAEYEHRHAQVVWRFRNPGNLAAFAQDPDVYMPVFGGHDPVHLGRGVAVAGHPESWAIVGGRLFLFRDDTSRRAFLAGPDHALGLANDHWPQVRQNLIGE